MRIVCQQTILMKYHALFVIFEKAASGNLEMDGMYIKIYNQFHQQFWGLSASQWSHGHKTDT